MRLFEFNSAPVGVYNPANDSLTKRKLTDTRKDKITLRDLHKLNKLRAFKEFKQLQRTDIISAIYGAGSGDDDMGGMDDF